MNAIVEQQGFSIPMFTRSLITDRDAIWKYLDTHAKNTLGKGVLYELHILPVHTYGAMYDLAWYTDKTVQKLEPFEGRLDDTPCYIPLVRARRIIK